VIVYRATGMLNVAQGEMATASAYVALVLHTPATPALAGTGLVASLVPFAPWPRWVAVLGALAAGALIGGVTERFVIRRVASHRSGFAVVSVTVGVLLAINGLTEWLWRPVTRGFPPLFPNGAGAYVPVFGARLRYNALGVMVTIVAVLLVLAFILRHTRLGLAFRAVSSDRAASELMGIRAGRITTIGWALAGAIGGLAACLVAPTVLLEPNMMVRVLIYSLVAATLGGLDSLGGAVLGGLVIGVSQTMIAGYVDFLGSELSLPGALAVMVAVLLFRPSGLFGTKRIERV
jgi:branched-chain amino acid transport system permease protein